MEILLVVLATVIGIPVVLALVIGPFVAWGWIKERFEG